VTLFDCYKHMSEELDRSECLEVFDEYRAIKDRKNY
jgi:hypothetical protein